MWSNNEEIKTVKKKELDSNGDVQYNVRRNAGLHINISIRQMIKKKQNGPHREELIGIL